jgi:HAD superfamily hydrolase (TIGR01458 family)
VAAARYDGVLLDIDGVLAVSWRALPGASDTIAWLREHDVPFRLITNTTTHTRVDLAATLGDAGIVVEADEIVTAVVATAAYLRHVHPGAGVFVLSDGDAAADLEGVRIVDDDPEVVVLGGAYEGFDYDTMNRVFRWLMDGAALVAMHRNLYWRTDAGLQLDAGAFLLGLEKAADTEAVVLGKPSGAFFAAALSSLGVGRSEAVMVGDDLEADVLGAQRAGITGVLVRTGKFSEKDEEGNGDDRPQHVVDSIADLPGLLGL